MKKVALLIIIMIFITLIFDNKDTPVIKDTEAQIYLGTSWGSLRPISYTVVNPTTWTDLAPSYKGSLLVCGNHYTIICIAKTPADADTKFAAGQFAWCEDGSGWLVPDYQSQSLYRIYGKCLSTDVYTVALDNAVAVDKGTTPETVGIPITGHSIAAEDFVTITGSVAYNGTFNVISKTANEIVIFRPYTAETFAGTESCVRSPTFYEVSGN